MAERKEAEAMKEEKAQWAGPIEPAVVSQGRRLLP